MSGFSGWGRQERVQRSALVATAPAPAVGWKLGPTEGDQALAHLQAIARHTGMEISRGTRLCQRREILLIEQTMSHGRAKPCGSAGDY